MSTTVLSLSDVSVRRGERVILGPLNFAITQGERWVVLGPNGAGKSTLLQILATKIFPTQGVVRVLDKQMGMVDLFELRTRIGLCGSVIAEDIPYDETVRMYFLPLPMQFWADGMRITTSGMSPEQWLC